MAMTVLLLFLPLCMLPRLLDLLLLLLHQECFHRVIFVVIAYQVSQFLLFWQYPSSPPRIALLPTFLILFFLILFQFPFLAHHGLPADVKLGRVLIVSRLVPGMVHADDPSSDVGATQIVHGQVSAALIFVFEPAKAFRFARLLVASEFEECRVAEL